MSKRNVSSKVFFPALIVVVLLGFWAGLVFAGGGAVVEAQPPLDKSDGDGSQRPTQSGTDFYYRVSGRSFLPSYTGYEYIHSTKGCLYRPDSNNNGQTYSADIRVPHGAEITTFNVYFNDNSPLDLDVDLIAYDNVGGETMIKDSGSTGSNGYGSVSSGIFSHTVDNIAESLAMIVTIPPNQNVNLQFCGTRLKYTYNISSNFLPAMLNVASP